MIKSYDLVHKQSAQKNVRTGPFRVCFQLCVIILFNPKFTLILGEGCGCSSLLRSDSSSGRQQAGRTPAGKISYHQEMFNRLHITLETHHAIYTMHVKPRSFLTYKLLIIS